MVVKYILFQLSSFSDHAHFHARKRQYLDKSPDFGHQIELGDPHDLIKHCTVLLQTITTSLEIQKIISLDFGPLLASRK